MFKTDLFNTMEKAMDASVLRQTVIHDNIANVNTPGFKRSEVSFDRALDRELKAQLRLKTTNSKHLPGTRDASGGPLVYQLKNTSLRNDGNNVDVDMELAGLAENNLYFNSLVQLLSSQLALLKHSISEGKR